MNAAFNQKLLLFIAVTLAVLLALCMFKPKPDLRECNCSIDKFNPADSTMMNIILNVDRNKDNQLFHVQPVIKDTTNCEVGIVAVIGHLELTEDSASIKSITFELVEEEGIDNKLKITSVSKPKDEENLEVEFKEFIINTKIDTSGLGLAVTPTIYFESPRLIGNGYKGDINFIIDDLSSISIPRICKFIIE